MSINVQRAPVFVEGLSNDICCPFVDISHNLYYLTQGSGEIVAIDQSGSTETIHNTNGEPSGAVFDDQGVIYIADQAHAAVLAIQETGENQQELVVGVYEDKPLRGPHSIACSSDGDVFFTDSGPFGETGLQNPQGSLFVISNTPSGQMLKPISLNNLAGPAGIALSPDGRFIYVCEMMTNRVLRYFQQPEGVYHASVFYQLSGGVGPVAVAVDTDGTVYVAQFEVKGGATTDGKVYVLTVGGKLEGEIVVEGTELSGLVIDEGHLYITERSTGSIYKMEL